jgi:hypothetical protein
MVADRATCFPGSWRGARTSLPIGLSRTTFAGGHRAFDRKIRSSVFGWPAPTRSGEAPHADPSAPRSPTRRGPSRRAGWKVRREPFLTATGLHAPVDVPLDGPSVEAGSTGHLPSVHGGRHWEHQLGQDRVGGVDVVTPVVHGVGDEATEPLVEVPRSTVKRLTHRKEERLLMFCRSGVAVCLSAVTLPVIGEAPSRRTRGS